MKSRPLKRESRNLKMANRTYHSRGVPVHGFAVREHPFYNVWADMLSRCSNANEPGFANYGGRGIKVCRRWHHFENFAIDMWPRPEGPFTIERKNNNRGYSKDNCRWATRTDQCVNRRKFKNNTSGYTGVVAIKGRFEARFDFEHIRYRIGMYDSAVKAYRAREGFLDLFFVDVKKAVASIDVSTFWLPSKTGKRGVTPLDGGFVSRATKDGVRHYLGYFKTIEEAENVRTRFLAC